MPTSTPLFAPQTARRWLDRFEAALRTLSHHPELSPLARENGKLELEVHILRIRRAQRRALTGRQLQRAGGGGRPKGTRPGKMTNNRRDQSPESYQPPPELVLGRRIQIQPRQDA